MGKEILREIPYKDREEWLEIRRDYIGGSDAGAVIGLNPYKSAYTLWAEKTGKLPEFEGNLTTKVGAYLEDLVAKLFEEETGKQVRRKNRILVNAKYPWACANLDRVVVGEQAFLEIKTTNSVPIMRALRSSEEFPEAYYAQVVHYLAVTGYAKAYLAVLINCRELKVYELERDEAEISALMTAEEQFWTCVKNNTPPAADGSESTGDTLRLLYPESTTDSVDLFAYESKLDEYTRLSAQIKELTAMKDECVNSVKQFMGLAGRGESDKYKVSYSTQERKTLDTKRLAADHRDIDLAGYYKVTQSRVFKVTAKGGASA